MNKNLFIFGDGDIAEIAYYYFSKYSEYKIKGFIVDKEFLNKENLCGIKIFTTEEFLKLEKSNNKLFIALGYAKLNKIRENKYLFFKKKGYEFANFISKNAIILNDGNIGENCMIFENNVIQPHVKIGNNVIIWSGNHIGHHSIIEDNVFISSHVVISGRVKIKNNTFIGVNSTFRDNIEVGNYSIIGAGSLILKDTENFSIFKNQSTQKSKITSDKI